MSTVLDNPIISSLLEESIVHVQEGKYNKAGNYFATLALEMEGFDNELFNEVVTKIVVNFKVEDAQEGQLSALEKATAVFADKQNILSNSVFASIYNDIGLGLSAKGQKKEALDYYIKSASTLKSIFSNHIFLPTIIKNINAVCGNLIDQEITDYFKQSDFLKGVELMEEILNSLKTASLIDNIVDLRLFYANLGIGYNNLDQHELALDNLYKVVNDDNPELVKTVVSLIWNSHQKVIAASNNDHDVMIDALVKMRNELPKNSPEAKVIIDHVRKFLLDKADAAPEAQTPVETVDDSVDAEDESDASISQASDEVASAVQSSATSGEQSVAVEDASNPLQSATNDLELVGKLELPSNSAVVGDDSLVQNPIN